jgi:predicted RND superfamily exporter protein
MKKIFLILITTAIVLVAVFVLLYILGASQSQSLSLRNFFKKDFYQQPPQDWEKYTNKDFDISFNHPSTMYVLQAIPLESYSIENAFEIHLSMSSNLNFSSYAIDIYGSSDLSQCDNIISYVHLPSYNEKSIKQINGEAYSINTRPLLFIPYGVEQVFGYIQKGPVCRIIRVTYMIPMSEISQVVPDKYKIDGMVSIGYSITEEKMHEIVRNEISKVDFTQMLQTVETVIGSITEP